MFRGQSGANAWILILLITLAMIGFILFMPAEQRQEVFDQPADTLDTAIPSEEIGEALLDEHVGRLEFFPPGPIAHPIPSVHLFSTTRSKVIEKFNPFAVERGVWSDHAVTKTFSLPNLRQVENVLLVFEAPVRDGVLTISLNGQVIAQLQPTRGGLAPITLKKRLLQRENTLTFEVSSPGWRIWALNDWQLEEARIVADIRDPTKQSASTTVTLSPVEHNNLLAAKLRFAASCDPFAVGPLEIIFNGQRVYQAIPDCETVNIVNVDASALVSGPNSVRLRAREGEYRLDSMELTTELKDVRSFVEFFEVDPELMHKVLIGDADLFLEMEFVDDGEHKQAQLNVNQHVTRIDQKDPFFARNINQWVEEGFRNYVEIVPETPLDIVQVRVVVQ